MKDVILVLISGASASGKTTLAVELAKKLKTYTPNNAIKLSSQLIKMDDYYNEVDERAEELRTGKKFNIDVYRKFTNFDKPDVVNFELVEDNLKDLSDGWSIKKQKFNFRTNHYRGSKIINPTDIIILEGLFVQQLAKKLPNNFKVYSIFVQTSSYLDIKKRRSIRDAKSRGITKEQTLLSEKRTVGPGFFKFVAKNAVGMDLYVTNDEHGDLNKEIENIIPTLYRLSDELTNNEHTVPENNCALRI